MIRKYFYRRRIILARKKEKHWQYGEMAGCENLEEILSILKWEDSLGAAIFINNFICKKNFTISQCLNQYIRLINPPK